MVHLIRGVASDYNLFRTITSGQLFVYDYDGDTKTNGTFLLPYGRRRCSLQQSPGDGTIMLSCNDEDIDYWVRFLSATEELDEQFLSIMGSNQWLSAAMSADYGIRIIKQEPWQTLVSFVISQNNNIPRISKCLRALCKKFGLEHESRHFHEFPTPEVLACADLSDCGLGYRDVYVRGVATAVANGSLPIDDMVVGNCTRQEALRCLMSQNGIGPKVAECVALYGLGFTECFPIDTWIKKAMQVAGITSYDVQQWGKHAGLVQQYMYYHARMSGVV